MAGYLHAGAEHLRGNADLHHDDLQFHRGQLNPKVPVSRHVRSDKLHDDHMLYLASNKIGFYRIFPSYAYCLIGASMAFPAKFHISQGEDAPPGCAWLLLGPGLPGLAACGRLAV